MNWIIKIFLLYVIVAMPEISQACSCTGKSTIRQAVKKADVVISAKVLKSSVLYLEDSLFGGLVKYEAEYTVLIREVYKGQSLRDTVKILTGLGSGDRCGYKFEVGEEYIIYAYYQGRYSPKDKVINKFLRTGLCTRTKRLEDKEIRKLRHLKD